MHAKIILALLIAFSLGFSTAPSWVKPGASINYSVGTDLVTFTVLNRTSADVKLEVFTKSTSHKAYPTENASAQYGQFWFDNASLSGAYSGKHIGDYVVSDISTQSYAGQQWETVSLEVTVSGAITTKVLDKKTGLLLKQTISAAGAPTVTLQKFYVPDWVQVPPANNTPPTPPVNTTGNVTKPPSQNNTTVTPPQNITPPSQNNTTVIQNNTPPEEETAANETGTTNGKKPLPCCTPALILLILGFATVYIKS